MAIQIIQNALWIPETDTFIKSLDRHDFVSVNYNGHLVAVDGGTDYFRSTIPTGYLATGEVVSYHLTTNSTIEEVKQKLLWGTRGKKGDEPLTWRPIRSLQLDHLIAIWDNVPNLDPLVKFVIKETLLDLQEQIVGD